MATNSVEWSGVDYGDATYDAMEELANSIVVHTHQKPKKFVIVHFDNATDPMDFPLSIDLDQLWDAGQAYMNSIHMGADPFIGASTVGGQNGEAPTFTSVQDNAAGVPGTSTLTANDFHPNGGYKQGFPTGVIGKGQFALYGQPADSTDRICYLINGSVHQHLHPTRALMSAEANILSLSVYGLQFPKEMYSALKLVKMPSGSNPESTSYENCTSYPQLDVSSMLANIAFPAPFNSTVVSTFPDADGTFSDQNAVYTMYAQAEGNWYMLVGEVQGGEPGTPLQPLPTQEKCKLYVNVLPALSDLDCIDILINGESHRGGVIEMEYDAEVTLEYDDSECTDTCLEFVGGVGDVRNNEQDVPLVFNIQGHKRIYALFDGIKYNIDLNIHGSGTVFPDDNLQYICNSNAILRAKPAHGGEFDGWTVDGSDKGDNLILKQLMETDIDVTATFKRHEFNLMITSNGDGTGGAIVTYNNGNTIRTLTADEVQSGSVILKIPYEDTVTVTAIPSSFTMGQFTINSQFAVGAECGQSDATIYNPTQTFTMLSDRNMIVTFLQNPGPKPEPYWTYGFDCPLPTTPHGVPTNENSKTGATILIPECVD